MPAGRVAAGQATGGASAAPGDYDQREAGLWHWRAEYNGIYNVAGGVRVRLCLCCRGAAPSHRRVRLRAGRYRGRRGRRRIGWRCQRKLVGTVLRVCQNNHTRVIRRRYPKAEPFGWRGIFVGGTPQRSNCCHAGRMTGPGSPRFTLTILLKSYCTVLCSPLVPATVRTTPVPGTCILPTRSSIENA